MKTLEQALEEILAAIQPLAEDEVAVHESLGRVPVREVYAGMDLPAFDNAAVDGYAVRTEDLAGATVEAPVTLEVQGTVAAGASPHLVLRPGGCLRIFTGALLPAGADSVVMQEDVVVPSAGRVSFQEPVRPWEGVRLAGGDVRLGGLLVRAGEPLRAGQIGLLSAAGHGVIAVHRSPRVAVLSTGNELVDPGEPLMPGRIYDSNRAMIRALADGDRIEVVMSQRIPDTLEQTMAALAEAARVAEVIVTTGGVSVGEADLVKAAVLSLGGTLESWRVAIKPGKPFAWGRLESAYWFGLPGNPVSAFVTWWLLVRPALQRLSGMREVGRRTFVARLGEKMSNPGDRRHWVRVRMDGEGRVWMAGTQASHIQSSLAEAEALLELPVKCHWDAGREVAVTLLP